MSSNQDDGARGAPVLSFRDLQGLHQKQTFDELLPIERGVGLVSVAVNAPTTAIFCATTPALGFGPLSPQATIWQTPEDLACRPCHVHGLAQCPIQSFDCGHKMPITQWVQAQTAQWALPST